MSKSEELYKYLAENHPALVKDHLLIPNSAVVEIPIKAPEGAVTRHESAAELLERVKTISNRWVRYGHVRGDNTHNVSATITIQENEWETVGEWMWDNKNSYNGLSVLPFFGGTYSQAPFEDITKEVYEEMVSHLDSIDLSKVIEFDDVTDLKGEVACGADGCEVK
jgi:ribonucleoside-diphosphate reductase alpha chain